MALATLAGFDGLTSEWKRDLEEYVSAGGSLLRILSAPAGTGKTHLARALQALAAERGFLVCQVDAAAQRTDDDLALHEAFCGGLTHPDALFGEDNETGLLSILQRVAGTISEKEVQARLRRTSMPIPAVATVLAKLIGALSSSPGNSKQDDDIDVTTRLMSGELVDKTRSLAKLRRLHPGPLLRALGRAPGKRDGRLWLESLLKALPALGFPGVLWILDEHDEATQRVMDRHIVQLRRLADRLAEGRLPCTFVAYLVLDDFPSRIRVSHAALDQRLRPVLPLQVRGRTMVPISDVRDVDPKEFLHRVAERVYTLVRGVGMPESVRLRAVSLALKAITLGGVNTRSFVQAFAAHLIETEP